jgi:hypothetical protein
MWMTPLISMFNSLELLRPQQREDQIDHHEYGYNQQCDVFEAHLLDPFIAEDCDSKAREQAQA